MNVSITPPNSVGYPSAIFQVADGSNAFIVVNWGDVQNAGLLRNSGGTKTHRQDGDTTTPAFFDNQPIDGAIAADGTGNFNSGFSGTGGSFTVKILNSSAFQVGAVGALSYSVPVGRTVLVGQRVYDKVGNIPMGCKVSGTNFLGNSGFRLENEAGDIVALGTVVKNNVQIFLNDDNDYYCSPQPLLATITVPKGVYGIQQLVSLINNQLNGLGNPNSKVPNKPYDSGLISGNYNGMINQGTQGFTTTIAPLDYRDAPDSIHLSEIDPEKRTTFGQTIPDHTLISAFDYAENWIGRQAINKKNRADFTTQIAGDGYIGYMMDNNIEGCLPDGLTLQTISLSYDIGGQQMFDVAPVSNCYNSSLLATNTNQGCKARSDYKVGSDQKSMTIGAPEANIQYDTDTSAFSLNNLHSSWRLPSHDILGGPITNKGEVGVGLKRCSEICDAQPYSQFQKIWGSTGRDNLETDHTSLAIMEARCVVGTNIMDDIKFKNLDTTATLNRAALMSLMTIGAKIEPVNATPHGDSDTRLPASGAFGGVAVEILEIVPAATKQAAYSGSGDGYPVVDSDAFYSMRVTLPPLYNGDAQVFAGASNNLVYFTVQGQGTGTTAEQKAMISSFQRPKSRTGGVIIYNFSQATAMKFSDRPEVTSDAEYSIHASFRDFFSSRSKAKKIWKTKTLWGKLGFSYDQFNDDSYYENIVQYCNPTNLKLRGITSDTVLDISTIPSISSQVNPSDYVPSTLYNAGADKVSGVQVFNTMDINSPRTELQKNYGPNGNGQMPMSGTNQLSYAGSIHTHTTMTNIVAKPTPISAEELPTLSKFGYYLITSDLVPTYKDIVSKGDPLGLLGVVPKTSLSSQDFIPLANSDIIQVLNQDTIINNVRVKILNPDLSNPSLSENSSVIIRIDVPIEPPQPNQPAPSEEKSKTPKKHCPKTGHKICKCHPTSVEKISKK